MWVDIIEYLSYGSAVIVEVKCCIFSKKNSNPLLQVKCASLLRLFYSFIMFPVVPFLYYDIHCMYLLRQTLNSRNPRRRSKTLINQTDEKELLMRLS